MHEKFHCEKYETNEQTKMINYLTKENILIAQFQFDMISGGQRWKWFVSVFPRVTSIQIEL